MEMGSRLSALEVLEPAAWRLLEVAALRNARARLLCLSMSSKHLSDTPRPFLRRWDF